MKHGESPKTAVGRTLGLCAASALATADGPDLFAVHGDVARKVLDMGAESTDGSQGRLRPAGAITRHQRHACFSPTLP